MTTIRDISTEAVPSSDSPTPGTSTRWVHGVLHFTVLLWGLTALLGKAITINALALVWYRVLIAAVLAGIGIGLREHFQVTKKQLLRLAAVGALVLGHWLAFYGCIKVAGIAVAVLCLSAIPAFTALIEPLYFKRRVDLAEIALGLAVMVGIVLLVRQTKAPSVFGVGLGLASAVCSAWFGSWNGIVAREETALRLTFFELGTAFVLLSIVLCLSPSAFVAPWHLTMKDAGLLLFLAVACTIFPWLWTARILHVVTPFTIAVAVTLEPVYSLFFAYLAYPQEERMGPTFYVGASVLVGVVLANALYKVRRKQRVVSTSST
jgi:drug/metabolite transporter (DMT)-like permease